MVKNAVEAYVEKLNIAHGFTYLFKHFVAGNQLFPVHMCKFCHQFAGSNAVGNLVCSECLYFDSFLSV